MYYKVDLKDNKIVGSEFSEHIEGVLQKVDDVLVTNFLEDEFNSREVIRTNLYRTLNKGKEERYIPINDQTKSIIDKNIFIEVI